MVWLHENRVYVAARDSTLEPGQLLTFIQRGKPVASGEVAEIYGAELALVRLSSGSLANIKRLDRLRIWGEKANPEPRRMLRLGFPSQRRSSLIMSCAGTSVASPSSPLAYRVEAVGSSRRWVRNPGTAMPDAWPDTLLIRLFDEVSDEEIALERGELDVAIFWPGEPSARLRDDRRWSTLFGTRSRGLLAAMWQEPSDAGAHGLEDLDLGFLNDELLHGDLGAWPRRIAAGDMVRGPRSATGFRFEVDPSLPGHRAFDHLLNQGAKPGAALERQLGVRIAYLDLPTAPPDTLDRRLRELGATPLFTHRCPVFFAPALGPYIKKLGTDVLVDLLVCESAERKP